MNSDLSIAKSSLPIVSDGDLGTQRRRLLWLIGLRWHGAAGLLAAIFIGRLLGLHLPVIPLLLINAGMVAGNYYYWKKVQEPVLDDGIALQQVIFDVSTLTLVLFFSGGFLNPFFTFYFFLVILAAILLPTRQSIAITLLITFCFVLQGIAHKVYPVDMKLRIDYITGMGETPFHVVGAPISFVLTTVITAYFTYVIMNDLRRREYEVRLARRQAELELRKVDNLLDRLEAGMLVLDRDQRVERVNDRLLDWFGPEGADEENACYRIRRFVPDDAAARQPQLHEIRLPTRTQGLRDFEIIVSPVGDPRGSLSQIVIMVLDVTEQKKSQAQWSQTQKLAAIGQLAAGVAHEINTPLGTISILAEEARDILREIPLAQNCPQADELSEALETIHAQIRRCKDITQGLLNFSRKADRAVERCSLNDVAHRAVELIRHKIPSVTLIEELAPALPAITTDVHGVERAVFNLLLNAADAVENNSHEKRIRIRTEQHDGGLVLRVIDNGHGIREEDLPHIFEPFFTTKPVGRGTGLGLYVTYGTLRELGGQLEMESKPGEGTTATIRLPDHDDE